MKTEKNKTPSRKKYLATATVIETYTTYVEARDEKEAFEICMKLPLEELTLKESVGEWEFEEVKAEEEA